MSPFFVIPFFSKTRIEALFSEYTYAHSSTNPRTENAKLMTKATDSVPIPLLQYRSPIQYPKFPFFLAISKSFRPIIPTKRIGSLVLFLYSIAKFRPLSDVKSL